MPETAPLPIAFVMASFDPGGTERQMTELIRRLDRSRWDVSVACLRSTGSLLPQVAAAAQCESFPLRSFKHVSTLDRLRDFSNWCREKRFAIVHAVDLTSNIFGLAGAALAGVPVRIGSRRDINPGRTALMLALQRAAYASAHLVIANAQAAADRLRLERVPARKIAVVHNGLDLDRFRPRSGAARAHRVVTVANLRLEKGHDVLIDAAARVVARFPDATFDLVGEGTEHPTLRKMVAERQLQHAVTFHGHTDDVATHLSRAGIFVLPSRTEAFPNALLEAMAAGLPSIASATGGILEIIEEGRTGLLTPVGDAEKLAENICSLMGDEARAAAMGAEARRAVEARFSFERMVSGFERVYVNQLARRGVAVAPLVQLAI